MNYIPVSLENQANPHAGASEVTSSASTSQTPSFNASEEKDKDVELFVVPSTLEEIALKHLGKVSENTTTSTTLVNTGSQTVNTGRLDDDDSPMPELKIFHKSEIGIFDEASYDEEGVITDFNSLPTEIEVSLTPTLRIHNYDEEGVITDFNNEDWDLIKAKIEANAELSKSMLGSKLQGEDFAKKMVDLVNQRKKYFAEERARAKRNKPMTQSQLKTYMMNYLKNQGTWKLSQLKNLSFKEVKEEFDKLVKQVESFAPIYFKATKASLKRFGEEL
ncbi:hypothetical protein Tco_0602229 [Tanacetum coccineum]